MTDIEKEELCLDLYLSAINLEERGEYEASEDLLRRRRELLNDV